MKNNCECCHSSSSKYMLIAVVITTLIVVEVIIVNKWEYSNSAEISSFFDTNTSLQQVDETAVSIQLEQKLRNATDNKVILIWISMFGAIGKNHFLDAAKCGNCEVTYDHTRINDSNIGAVLFHFHAFKSTSPPPIRNLSQLYIYWDMEPTGNLRRRHSLKFEEEFQFNATLTYRRDSEFYQSYENCVISDMILKNTLTLDELLKVKTKTAVAIVSNCNGSYGANKRLKMLKELMGLGLNMEGYGRCFSGKGIFANGHKHGSVIFRNEVRKYKFYFSFENSYHCKDYISEKFFRNALRSLTLPVVWGETKGDYEAVAPPGSFIFAEDFASIKELADYMKYLMKNDTAYLEYFRWLTMKPSDMPQYGRARGCCHICRALHGINIDDTYNPKYNETNPRRPLFTDGVAQRIIPNLIGWFYGEDNPECFT